MQDKDPFDTKVKKEYRRLWKEFISRNLKCKPKDAKVAFFPGPKALEWDEVYKPLGFDPKNCYGIERDVNSVEEIRSRNPPFNVVNSEALDFFLYCADKSINLDTVNLDYTEYPQIKHFSDILILTANKILKKRSLMGLNFLGQREQQDHQQNVKEFLYSVDVENTVRDAHLAKLSSEEFIENRENFIDEMLGMALTNGPTCDNELPMIVESPLYEELIRLANNLFKLRKSEAKVMRFDKRKGIIDYYEENEKIKQNSLVQKIIIKDWMDYFAKCRVDPALVALVLAHQQKPYNVEKRECYEYHSGSRMTVDFLVLDRNYDYLKPIESLLTKPMKSMINHLSYLLMHMGNEEALSFIKSVDRAKNILIKNMKKNKPPEERIMITIDDVNKQYSEKDDLTVKRKDLKNIIFNALSNGKSDEYLMEEYDLEANELRGYKAAYTRVFGKGRLKARAKKTEEPKKEKPNNYGFSGRERRMIDYGFENGMRVEEIADKLKGKYTARKIMSYGKREGFIEGNENGSKRRDIDSKDLATIDEYIEAGFKPAEIATLFENENGDKKYSGHLIAGRKRRLDSAAESNS